MPAAYAAYKCFAKAKPWRKAEFTSAAQVQSKWGPRAIRIAWGIDPAAYTELVCSLMN